MRMTRAGRVGRPRGVARPLLWAGAGERGLAVSLQLRAGEHCGLQDLGDRGPLAPAAAARTRAPVRRLGCLF